MISFEEAKIRSEIIKAMAHPARLMILEFLKDGEKSVGEINTLLGKHLSTTSKHLLIMKNAGLVADRKDGNHVYYYLRVPCILDFFECISKVIKSNIKQQIKAA